MKSILFAALFLFVPKLVICQTSANDKTVYLDSLWNETTEGNHQYYRTIRDYYYDKENYQIKDYYKSGVLQMEGTSKTKDGISREGEFIFYYENGNKRAVSNYKKSRPNGSQLEWYENGNKKLEGEYIEDEKTYTSELKINQFWDTNKVQKVIDGNGDYQIVGNKFFSSGKIKNGFKDGLWEGNDSYMYYSFSENYENQKLISGVSIDSNKATHNYKVVELRPMPKKGYNDFYKHVGKHFKTPELPKGVGGKIYIGFFVDIEGKIVEPKILKGFGYGTNEEAIKVLTSYGNWLPGEIRGIKARCAFTLPITIMPYQ